MHGHVVLAAGVWKSIFGIYVFNVSLAFGCIQKPSEGKIKDILFWFLCCSANYYHKYNGSDSRYFSYLKRKGHLSDILRDFLVYFCKTYDSSFQ